MKSKYKEENSFLLEKHCEEYYKLLKRECENLFEVCDRVENNIKCAACPLVKAKM